MKVFEEKGCGSDSWTRVIIAILLLHYSNVSYKRLRDKAKIMNEKNPASYLLYDGTQAQVSYQNVYQAARDYTTENHAKQYEAEPIKAQGQTGPIKF